MNKKGVEPVTVIVGVVLAVLVLIIVAAFFVGGFGKLGAMIVSFFTGAKGLQLENAIQMCNLYYPSSKYSFCCATQEVSGQGNVTCQALGGKVNWVGFDVNSTKAAAFCSDANCPA